MPDPLILNFEQIVRQGRPRRTVFLCHPTLPKEVGTGEGIFFEFERGAQVPEPTVLDSVLFCFLFVAMERGAPLVIRGPISTRAMRNARLFQEAWQRWLPSRYRTVDIIPDRLLPEWHFRFARKGRAIVAFSGGIDATFTAIRHGRKLLGASSHSIGAVLSVQGFDIDFANNRDFDALVRRTQPLIESLGLHRHLLRTNIRTCEMQNWGHSHGAQIISALHQFSHEFQYGLIASSRPYSQLINAWGSHAATDYLLSGEDFEVVHDGAGFLRTQKVKMIASDPVARSTVKVCWEGAEQHKNCGRCGKCIRTRLNFLAIGDSNPPCFDTPFELGMIEDLTVDSEGGLLELHSIIDYANKAGIKESWVPLLERRVAELEAPRAELESVGLKRERDDLRRKLKMQVTKTERLQARLAAIYDSTSWRVTNPLRAASKGREWLRRVVVKSRK
jgi:hypothetical protein